MNTGAGCWTCHWPVMHGSKGKVHLINRNINFTVCVIVTGIVKQLLQILFKFNARWRHFLHFGPTSMQCFRMLSFFQRFTVHQEVYQRTGTGGAVQALYRLSKKNDNRTFNININIFGNCELIWTYALEFRMIKLWLIICISAKTPSDLVQYRGDHEEIRILFFCYFFATQDFYKACHKTVPSKFWQKRDCTLHNEHCEFHTPHLNGLCRCIYTKLGWKVLLTYLSSIHISSWLLNQIGWGFRRNADN